MNIDDKEIKLITKLNRETSKGLIKWSVESPPKSLTTATEDEIFIYFKAPYKNKFVAIYERKYKHFYSEHDFYWGGLDVFAILDDHERVLLEFSKSSPALRDLFVTVREQVADLDGLLDGMLE